MDNKFKSQLLSDIINDNNIETAKLEFDSQLPKSKYYNIESYEIQNIKQSKELNRPIGKYVLITLNNKDLIADKIVLTYANVIKNTLLHMLPKCNNDDTILIVGLGNEKIDADSLGHNVCSRVLVTRLINENKNIPKTAVITPSVMGETGIESSDIVFGIVNTIKPKCVIVIDSLCATSYKRLGCSIQVTNAGLTPGEGVKSPKKPINKNSLGCEVITIGVPLMIYAKSFCIDNNDIDDNLIVTFHDVDNVVKNIAKIIAKSINMAIFNISDIDE